MKKNVLLAMLLSNAYFFILAQNNFSGVIKYKYIVFDNLVGNRDIPAYLYFNAQKSLFDYDKLAYMRPEDSLEVKFAAISNNNRPAWRKRDAYGQMYFMDKTKNELYIREFIYRAVYITHEPIPVIAWQLKNEVKTISGYVCKKAEATFRGRKYTVWYTSAIPVSVGPWKLQGLPGAILEAKSEDGEVSFETESIRIPADVQKELSFTEIPNGKLVTFEEYLKAFEKEYKLENERIGTLLMSMFEKAEQDGVIPQGTLKNMHGKPGNMSKEFRIEKYE